MFEEIQANLHSDAEATDLSVTDQWNEVLRMGFCCIHVTEERWKNVRVYNLRAFTSSNSDSCVSTELLSDD